MDWEKCTAGDRNAWVDAAEEFISFGMALAKQKCPWLSEEGLEDAAVIAFREVQVQINSIRTESDFRARFTDRVRYRVVDEVRENAERKALTEKIEGSPGDIGDSYQDSSDPNSLPFTSLIKAEDRALINQCLNELAPEDKSLLFDRYVLEMKQREIAEKYGWGISSVTARIEGALKRAKEALLSNPKLKDLPGIKHDEI